MARCLQQVERNANDRALHHRIIRLAARVAERKIREHETGNSALLDDIPRRAEYHRREAIRLKVPSDQTHGLVANWSQRDEKHNIYGVGATESRTAGAYSSMVRRWLKSVGTP